MAAHNDYLKYGQSLEGPIAHAFEITPSDTLDLPQVTRSLYVGSAGNVTVTMLHGAVVTYVGMLAGVSYPLRVRRVHATGTSASALIGEL